MRVQLALTLLTAVLVSGVNLNVLAQQPAAKKPHPRFQPPAKTQTATMKYQPLVQPPRELPAMTQIAPPASQYVFGTKSTTDQGMTQVELRWHSSADGRSILQTYASQFSQPGWKSITNKSQTTITGMFNKNVCTVQILAPSGGKTTINDVQLTYQFLER